MSEHTFKRGEGRIRVSVRGARILDCKLPDAGGNLFWNNDANTGGDRLWIAPEVAYYWPSLEQAREDPVRWASTPPQVDPGDYRVAAQWDSGLQLDNQFELTDSRDGGSIALRVMRTIDTNLQRPHALPGSLQWTGFTITNVLMRYASDDGAVAGAWDILQVPPTGTLICPATRPLTPTSDGGIRSYYNPFGDRHVRCDDRAVRFLIDGKRRIKMGIRPEDSTGRMGYYRPIRDGVSSLIVRIFAPLPGDTYVDVPRDHDAAVRQGGDALQAYNDDGAYGGFGEMEYHDPAVIGGGPAHRSGSCVTHVLCGPDEAVRAAGQALLGTPVAMLT